MIEKDAKIYLSGHRGLVGGAIYRRLKKEGFTNIITRTHTELDLCNQADVDVFFATEKPEYVILAAAKVGGIMANSQYPAEFIYQNLMIGTNIVNSSYKYGVKKMLNLGSSCIYPRMAPQPMKESCLLTSELEKTNEAYALAKISIIKLCKYYNEQYGTNYISGMPTNQYGIGDNFNMETAHLLPMILRRFHLAKMLRENNITEVKRDLHRFKLGWGLDGKLEKASTDTDYENIVNELGAFKDKIVLWGDGSVFREMMCSDDLADACVYLLMNKDYNEVGELVNITKGDDIQLKELFEMVKRVVGYEGEIVYDKSKPNGTPRKMMDATHIKELGWEPKINLEQGITNFYRWYLGEDLQSL